MLGTIALVLALLIAGRMLYILRYSPPQMIIKLIRHGESTENVGEVKSKDVGDHTIELTTHGWNQGFRRGQHIGRWKLTNALIFLSPYQRTRQTRIAILQGAGFSDGEIELMSCLEDPLLREVEAGYAEMDAQLELRAVHKYFYYRFDGGESPADAYARISLFIDSLHRQFRRKYRFEFIRQLLALPPRTVFVVGHGLSHRLFIMRWLHLTVEEFDRLANPNNCDEITIAPIQHLKKPQLVKGRWGVQGVRWRL